jgi:Domain of unknown function (DUF4398)
MNISHSRKIGWLAAVSCASFALAACTSATLSKDAVDNSTKSVAEASSAGGAELAPQEMGSAQEKLARANKALTDHDYKEAHLLADEAQADAQLAQTKATSLKAQQAAATLQDDIRAMREELIREESRTE